MNATRRHFLKSTGMWAAAAAITTSGLVTLASQRSPRSLRLVPVDGEYYSPGMLKMMQTRRFPTMSAAMRAVKNPRLRFVVEHAA
jgi:hypothetical protein